MTLQDLKLRVRALISRRRVEQEIDEELAFHIERDIQRHIDNGLSPAEARAHARARFGSVALVADQCRDARGTALVDDLARDILYAFRTFHRAPLAALTIVATVGLGLGLVAAVFAAYSMIFLRVDAVRGPGELFAVERATGPGADALLPLTKPEYEALRRETSVFTDAFALLRPVATRMEGRSVPGALVTGNFFNVLGVQAALGRTLTPADDEQSPGRPVIVLSHVGWSRQLAGDPAVIGRSVHINGFAYEIVGVMPEDFRGLQIGAPDYWAPLALAGQFRDAYAAEAERIPLEVVGRLKPGMSPDTATAGLRVWASGQTDPNTSTGRPVSIQLRPRQGTLGITLAQSLAAFSPIFFAFGLILMIGCANVANLLLARGISRQREIGIRLALGASRRRIVRQLLTENLLLAFVAAVCGLAISRLFLTTALHVLMSLGPGPLLEVELARFVPPTDWRVAVFLLVGAIASTVFFGLAPALQATRLELVRTMRGELTRDARPRRARHALIAVQVGASALLLIGAVIFLRGALAAATKPPGVRTTDTVRVSIANEPRRAAVLQAVTAHPLVAVVAASSPPRRAVVDTSAGGAPVRRRPGEGGETSSRLAVGHLAVSSEYFDVLGIEVVSGRAFTPAERTAEAGVVIVSETIARRLWPNGDGVGQLVRLDVPPLASQGARSSSEARSAEVGPSRTAMVVGVVRDPGRDGGASYLDTFRGVYVPTGPDSPGTWLMLRVRGNPEQASQALLERLTSIDPALSNIITLQMIAGLQTYVLQVLFWLAVLLGGLALVLTVSGLFSVLSYVVEQQAKEIGVRMALGATTKDVVELVLSQSLRPVGIGFVAGGGLAAAVAVALVAIPDASEIGAWVNVLDPVAYAASLLIIVTSCALAVSVPALRAARIDPIATLRRD